MKNIVPDNTIAVFYKENFNLNDKRVEKMLTKAETQREWFPKELYKISPNIKGNSCGFLISAEYEFKVHWNGEEGADSISINIPNDEAKKYGHPDIVSTIGSGIFTVNIPFLIKTPPNVNILTINPPNYILPLSTVLSSMIESDSLKTNFTFNIKIQVPDAEITFPAGHPIGAFIPIPKHYIETFELKPANEIFNEKTIKKELKNCEESEELDSVNIYTKEMSVPR